MQGVRLCDDWLFTDVSCEPLANGEPYSVSMGGMFVLRVGCIWRAWECLGRIWGAWVLKPRNPTLYFRRKFTPVKVCSHLQV